MMRKMLQLLTLLVISLFSVLPVFAETDQLPTCLPSEGCVGVDMPLGGTSAPSPTIPPQTQAFPTDGTNPAVPPNQQPSSPSASPAAASQPGATPTQAPAVGGGGGGLPGVQGGGGGTPAPSQSFVPFINPISVGTIQELIQRILQFVVQLSVPFAVFFVVLTGYRYVVAQGKPDKLSEANKTLLYTVIGIMIILGAQLISLVLQNTINQLR